MRKKWTKDIYIYIYRERERWGEREGERNGEKMLKIFVESKKV